MQPTMFCQSCTMPIDDVANRGTEKDGSPSTKYCKYCYQQGRFTDAEMTLEKMSTIVTTQMQKRHLPEELIQISQKMLPGLTRWRQQPVM